MDTRLFEIDPLAGIGYGMYNALKKGEGSFEDFLLHYDSHASNEGDNAWLSRIVMQNMNTALSSPAVLEAMSLLGVSLDITSTGSFFDTQVSAYKLQLLQEMQKRENKTALYPKEIYQNLDTITL